MNKIQINVIRGEVLGAKVYRGFAKICDLALASKADIFDQQKNPRGTQRDLSPKHAKDAYEYIKESDLGYLPEVFLCARIGDVIKYVPSNGNKNLGRLTIDMDRIEKAHEIMISRVDGN